jgi:hypothetical protein
MGTKPTIFLFGESERGEFGTPLFCYCLAQLSDLLGNPPEESQGLHYAIQSLLYNRPLLFCRVQEEGFSTKDYLKGFKNFKKSTPLPMLQAIVMPGVGNGEIIKEASEVCSLNKSLLVITEKDLYDYLMSRDF